MQDMPPKKAPATKPRGGARPGAGRPRKYTKKRISVTCRFQETSYEILTSGADARKTTMTDLLEGIIADWASRNLQDLPPALVRKLSAQLPRAASERGLRA